jgi:hypothetical protein
MALVVGTNSYISLVDARAYVAQYALPPLPVVDADAESLLIRAASAMDQVYGNQYLGNKVTSTQQLGWPRDNFGDMGNYPKFEGEYYYIQSDSYGNPRDFSGLQPETANAQVELASKMQVGLDPYEQPTALLSQYRTKVASLEEESTYKSPVGYRTNPLYKISLILRPLLRNSAGNVAITRGA